MNKEKTFLKRYHLVILIVFSLAILVPEILQIFGVFDHIYFIETALHSAIEAIGAIMSILIAILIFIRFSFNKGELDYHFIAMGFLGMGIFDLLHSFLNPGNHFVVTHVFALLSAGFWFGLLVLPEKIKIKLQQIRIDYVVAFIWVLVILALSFTPSKIPILIADGEFTNLAFVISVLSSIGFFAGVFKLLLRYRKENESEIFLIAVIAFLQGLACILFRTSEVWDLNWWIWHFCRLTAATILFYSFFIVFRKMYSDLKVNIENQNAILDAMPFGLMIIDKNKKVLQINQAAKKLTGFSDENIIGKSCFDTVCNQDCDNCTVIDLKQKIQDTRVVIKKQNGDTFPGIKTVTPILFGEKEVLLEGFVDISETVKAQEELQINEQKFRVIFDSASNGIMILDFEGRIIDVNETAMKQYGYSKEEFIKLTPANLVRPDYMPTFNRFLSDLKESGSFSGETIDLRKDGSEFYTDVRGSIINFNGKPHLQASVLDVTDKKIADIELKKSMLALEQANKELEQFAYVSSHDLQEPLRKIRSYTDLFEKHCSHFLDERGRKYLSIINSGANRMQVLINDLLQISRITSRSSKLSKIDIRKIILGIEGTLEPRIREENALLKIPDNLPIIKCDKIQITQIFQNIIDNALKYRSTADPIIEVNAKEEKDHWLFSVKDNGIGFNQQYAKRIFVVFQRLHARDKYEGTGIGLAICKKLIERHQGEIWAEAEEGVGATFYFKIPKKINI
jgi:PAS domain S-box-containing protein